MDNQQLSVFPPPDFVQRFNEGRPPAPAVTAMGPLMMLAWHQVTAARQPSQLLIVTGI